jgi:hypothetical protein|tara:strand:- start:107 stop:481 length:375 start_codon:yes stop_codon:yes gene_type:complete
MDWNTLTQHNYKKIKIDRLSHIEKSYINNKTKYINYDNYILKNYLHNKLYNLQPNKYPYNLKKNIKHYVLWLNPMLKYNYIYDKKFINKLLKKKIKNKEFYFYMNSNDKRSIKTVPHYQVFIKV